MKKNNKKNAVKATELLSEERAILNGEYGLETETYYHENGEVTISVCDFDRVNNILADGKTSRNVPGVMTIYDCGDGRFIPRRRNPNPDARAHETIARSPHGRIDSYKNCIVVRFKFQKNMLKKNVIDFLSEESEELTSWISKNVIR